MARFFINRPIFAWVLAIIVMLAGAMAIKNLAIAQYPQIAPPTISVSATYTGASAQTVEDSVTQVIEQSMQGLDGLAYMSSTSSADGSANVTLTFNNGVNADTAQVQVQNKVSQVSSTLPSSVQQVGVTVTKSSSGFLEVVAFTSKDGRLNNTDLADYVASNIQEPLSRVQGVGSTQLFGAQYAMRIWLDPDKLVQYKLTTQEIISAIGAKNTQVSAGQIGGLPAVDGQQINATITAQSKLKTVDEFKNIVLSTQTSGAQVRLEDVARIELGSQSYNSNAKYNGQPAAAMAISLATGANALDTAKRVTAKLNELSKTFPDGVEIHTPYDTTPFVSLAIKGVVETLLEAVVLVFCVMFLFLQNWRATLIPTIAVPVVLLGTFGVLYASGFTINTLTMFAMVLAIGLLVDDAIVVVENVERVMNEEGLSPHDATIKSMDQIGGALVSITTVLSAVFIPMAFFGGSTGVIYRQFSITIVSAMVLSVLVAMVLTPALCATLLKPVEKGHVLADKGFFGKFNQLFNRGQAKYTGQVGHILSRSRRYMLIYGALLLLMVLGFMRLPSSFLPDEDQGMLMVSVQLPAGASAERTNVILKEVEQYFLNEQKGSVDSLMTINGFSFSGSGQNMGFAFIKLKPWDERGAANQKASSIQMQANMALSKIREANIFAMSPPAIQGLGNSSGFEMKLQDTAGLGHEALMQARNQFLGAANQNPKLVAVRANGLEDGPQLKVDIDEDKAGALGVALTDIHSNLSSTWGGSYVNDFLDRGRVKKVYVQADAPYRMSENDLSRWYIKNSSGAMVAFSSFANSSWINGSPRLERYNGLPAISITGSSAQGVSTGTAMDEAEKVVAALPAGVTSEWSGISLQEKSSGSQATWLYIISIVFVFLCLAALYESWSIPFAVIMVVPLGLLGAIALALISGKSNDVYFKVGLLTTVGLAAKNAILIVEFAKAEFDRGRPLREAVLDAARLRLRPILMTSFAFILGVLPMMLSSSAGSGAQNALGTAVVGGMISGTFLAIFFVPLFFVLVLDFVQNKWQKWMRKNATTPQSVNHTQG